MALSIRDLFRHYDVDSIDNMDLERIDLFYRLFHTVLERYFRAEVRHLDRIPPGPALYVGNHSGGILTFDSFVSGPEAAADGAYVRRCADIVEADMQASLTRLAAEL